MAKYKAVFRDCTDGKWMETHEWEGCMSRREFKRLITTLDFLMMESPDQHVTCIVSRNGDCVFFVAQHIMQQYYWRHGRIETDNVLYRRLYRRWQDYALVLRESIVDSEEGCYCE